MEEEGPQSRALRNPIILQQIFQYEPLSGQTLRLVCHFWNEITLSLPRPKVTLCFDPWQKKTCCNSTPFQVFCIGMEPRLARSINPVLVNCDHSPGQNRLSTEAKLLHVSGQFGHLIENLSITCANPDLIPTLYEILEKCCPNLKRLKIYFRSMKELENSENTDNQKSHYPTDSHLNKLIYLRIYEGIKHPSVFKMTQWLLISAPNLTHFVYDGKQLPDLGRNRSIKVLRLTMSNQKISDIQSENHIRSVNKILDQVKDTVEFLTLTADWVDYEGNVGTAPIDLQIPKMKNLKEFENSILDLFSCGDKLQDISSERIPTLQSLRISTSRKAETSLNNLFRNIMTERDLFSGVKNLHLKNLHDPELIAGLKIPFPNLQRLSISQFDKNTCPFINMEPYLRAYASLGLKFLEMDLSDEHDENLTHFIQGFSNCGELLSGLTSLKITIRVAIYYPTSDGVQVEPFWDDLDLVQGGIAQMREWLLRMKGLQDVHISGMIFTPETRRWMEPFIQENKIPIVFKKY